MANVNKILLPRRAKKCVMDDNDKRNIILEKGEIFFEFPNSGIGKGHVKVKIGDGSTPYNPISGEALPYALGDTSNDVIDFSNRAETDVDYILNEKIKTGNPLETLIGYIKNVLSLLNKKDKEIDNTLSALTAGRTIKKVEVVNTLPQNPNPTTLYLIRS